MSDKLEDLDAKDGSLKGLGSSRHFSYFAAEAGSGEERWHHTSADFHKDIEGEGAQLSLRPQNDYRCVLQEGEAGGKARMDKCCREQHDHLAVQTS